jgi:hypothetical protein
MTAPSSFMPPFRFPSLSPGQYKTVVGIFFLEARYALIPEQYFP